MKHSQSRTSSLHSALRLEKSPHLTRRECMRYRALTPSPRLVPPYPPVASNMAQIADHLRTAFVQSVQDHGVGGQQLLSLSSDLNVEATRQIQLTCGQPTASLCDALRWLSAQGKVMAVTSVAVQLHPWGLFLTATCEFVRDQQRMVIEHLPLYLARSHSLLHHIEQQCMAVQDLVKVSEPNSVSSKVQKFRTSSQNCCTLWIQKRC